MIPADFAQVHAFYDAAEKGDEELILSTILDPAVQWSAPAPLPYGGTHEGHDGFMAYRRGIKANFQPGYRFMRDRDFRCGDQIIVTGRLEAKAKATGSDFTTPFAHVWTVRDGKVVARHYHVDTPVLLTAFNGTAPDADGSDLDVVRGVYEATGRGDQEAVVALLDPDVEWRIPAQLPYGGVFHGPDGVMNSRAIANEHFQPGQKFTPEHLFRSEPQIVGLGRMQAVVQSTGQPVEAPFVHVWTVAGGKVVARTQYTDVETILDAIAADRDTDPRVLGSS